MEVLFVSHKYPPSTGGMEKQSYELITGMYKHAVVHKIVYTGEESYIHFFRTLNDRILKCIHSHPHIELVHFNDGLIASLSLWHSGYQHLKRVVTVHGLDIIFPLGLYQRFILPRFNRYDHIIAVSRATAEAAIQRGIRAEKVSVIANGIDHDLAHPSLRALDWESIQAKYGLPKQGRYLMTLGRPVRRKGFSWFIRDVLPSLPEDVQLIMAGPFQAEDSPKDKRLSRLPVRWKELYMLFMGYPSDQEELRHLLRDPAYSNRIKHIGKVPLDDLQVLLKQAEAFLMPNIKVEGDMEGFGLVCLEASCCGTLVLAANTEGITDAIIDGKNGQLVPSQNAEAWHDTITNVLNGGRNEELRHEYRSFTLANFSWQKMVDAYAQLFAKLVKE